MDKPMEIPEEIWEQDIYDEHRWAPPFLESLEALVYNEDD